MEWMRHETGYTVVLSRGEELVGSLAAFARKEGIRGAHLAGVGAVEAVELGFFRLAGRTYDRHTLEGEFELLGLLGNVALKEGGPLVHAHVVLGREDLSCVGGHLFAATVSVTAEIDVRLARGGELHRRLDEVTGLWLLAR